MNCQKAIRLRIAANVAGNKNISGTGRLYPNPARTVVYYEDNLNDIEKGIIQLQDISGRKLKTDLAKGMYMVKIKINGRTDENKKLLIQ